MSRIKLDLSQFKHIKSENGMTTLQHKAGHILTIANKALSPEGQAQLNQLAKMTETPEQADEMKHKMWSGGNVQEMMSGTAAQGGKINATNQKLAESKKTPPSNKFAMPISGASSTDAAPMAAGGEVQNSVSPDNTYNHYVKDKGIVGGTVFDGSTDEKFLFGDYCFDIDKAREISSRRENASIPVDQRWIDKTKIDPKEAMKSTSTNPVFIAQLHTPNGIKPLLIDGNHRMYKAVHHGVKTIPAYVFTPEQTASLFVKKPENVTHPAHKKEQTKTEIFKGSIRIPRSENRQMFAKGGMVFRDGKEKNVRALMEERQCYAHGTRDKSELAKKHMANGGNVGVTPRSEYFADGGQTSNTKTDDQSESTDSTPPLVPYDAAKAAQKGLNEPASQQLDEGVKRLLDPSTWYADGGNTNQGQDPSTLFVNQTPEAKPSPQDAESMAQMAETNPIETAITKTSPEDVEQARNMAMGTMGTVKLAALPEAIGPEIQATATKLAEALQERGLNDQVTQSLAQKLKGLHETLSKYSGSGMVKGGKIRQHLDSGGNVSSNISNEPPPSLNANAEDLTPTSVPTQLVNESISPEQQKMQEDRQAYQQGHDRDIKPFMPSGFMGPVAGLAGMAMDRFMKGSTPEEREQHAAEAGLNNVAVMHEDKEAAALKQQQNEVQTSKVNSQLQALGLPPLPNTNQPNSIDSTPPQPDQATMARLNSGQNTAMQAPGSNDPFSKYQDMIGQGYKNELAGINKAATTAGQRGSLEEQALQTDMTNKQAASDSFKNSFQELNNERLAHINDIQNGYIDPDQYWTGTKNPVTGQMEGGHSKLMAGIGMIMAGFNPTGNPNQAIQMLQYQMNRNLDAQKANLGAKQNLLTANLHQFGNLRDATDMTRVMQHDMVSNELQQAAAKTTLPAAKAAALQASGQLQMQVAPIMQQFAMRKAFMNLANSGSNSTGATEQMLNYMDASGMPQAKEMRDRYVPGLGIAATPVPQDVKNRIGAYQNVNRVMNQAMEFAKAHEYNMESMNPSDRAMGATIQNELLSQIRQAESQGVYKESEAKFMKDTLGGNPAGFWNAIRTQPKLMEMQQLKTNEYHNLLQNLGGNLLRNAQAVPAQVHSAPQNIIHDSSGKPFTRQVINGKTYMVPVR